MAEFSSWEDTDREMKLKQIPSSVKSQDVSHILTTIFKDLLSKNSFNTEIIENQVNSKGSDDPYHERYVSELQKALKEKESRVAQITNLERYIIQAQARALSADEKHYNKYWSVGIYKDITTPNINLQCHSVFDKKMLKENGLLIPDDYTTYKRISVPPPEAPRQVSQYPSKTAIKPTNVEQKLENQSNLTYSHSEKSIRNTEAKQITKKKDLVFPVTNAWKEYPSLAERIKEKTIMAKMEAKANFLRNPRHQNLSLLSGMTSLIHQKKNSTQADISLEADNDEESTVFIALPKEIVFNEYKTGNIYEATLELKNVSTVLRSCRVLPPASKYFTIGLGQFPGDHGLVAPGMSCIYTIRFAPDSLGDFLDELKIITQTSKSFSVPLLGKRPHPVLTLPPTINLGYCLVGAVHMTQVVIKNNGGAGCFCLLPASSWPATNFRTVVREETVSIPPFVIRPSTFEMLSDQVGVLEIVFQPEVAETFQEKVTIVCDNCQVKHIDIIGVAQKAEVMIVSSEDVSTEPALEENPDKMEKHFIRFDNLNLFSYQEKRFMVKNCTNINLSFYWVKYRLTKDPTNQETFIYTKEIVENPPFCIYPEYGNIPPAETLSFETVFAPEKVDCYKYVLQMIFENVPNMQITNEENNVCKNGEISGGELATDNQNEYVSLSIELQGVCVPFNVMLRPYAMFIHGQIYSGITERREFLFINNSISSIKFNWELFNNEFFILEVEPANATLDRNQEMQLQLCVTGCCPGPINHQLKCYLEYQDEPIYYNVQADIKGADVTIEEPNVDFGLVCHGECVTREITLNNKSPIQAQFSIQEAAKSNSDLTELKIFPENGTLQPLESCKVSISYNAQNVLLFTKYIYVQIMGGEKRTVLVYGEVQNPQVVLESCQLHMEGLYHNVPGTYQVTLINNTLLQTKFEWQQAFGSQAKFCDIQMVPQSGDIGPREKKTIDLIFTAYNKVLFYDIYICCEIYGMETQPCLSLSGDVLGVDVEYRISLENSLPPEQSNEAEMILNFGESVLINSLSHGYIHILNHSAIDTTFKAYIEQFPARLPSPPATDEKYKNCHSRRDSIWKKLNNIKPPGTFLTSIDTEQKNSYLRDNNGAAFLIIPQSGKLSAYGSVVLQVSAINNMWGQYSDTFCCQVGDLEMVKIPIILNVVGAPLKFLMVGPNTDQAPKLRFGSQVAGNDSTDRKLRICNTSPFDIRVDWIGYNIYDDDDDDKLLDFKVIYGDAFPILGEDGLEMCPPAPESLLEQSSSESIETVQKQRKDAILDSENFIKTMVDIHSGTQSDKPFTIIPKQMVIPANSDEAYVMVRFSPPLAQEVTHEFNCVSFGLGYLNLCNFQETDKSSRIFRPQGYNIAPLTIHMTAHVLPAQLYVDFMGEDQLYFECNLCELLENNKLCEQKMMTSSVKLINLTQTSMNFMLLTKEPFTFTNLQLSSLDEINEKHSTFFTLYPQKHLMVKVGFLLSAEILNYRQMLEAGDDTCLLDGVSLKTVGKEIWMQFNNAITVKFKNETTQTITTEAKVALPDFDVSTHKIDLGICWIGQEKWEEFTLINTSQSKTLFFINTDVSCSCCDTKTFYTEPSSGYLEGHVNHTDAYWIKIRIFFAAKKVGGHQAILNISGIMGEKTQQIKVKGYGSHDGLHCSVTEG